MVLKKRMQREGIFREMKLRSHYENPLERKRRRRRKAIRRNAASLVMLPAANQRQAPSSRSLTWREWCHH